jgi:hypothetical protein
VVSAESDQHGEVYPAMTIRHLVNHFMCTVHKPLSGGREDVNILNTIEDEYLFYTLIEPLGSNGWSSSFGVNLILRTTCKFADEMGYSLKCFFCKLSAE